MGIMDKYEDDNKGVKLTKDETEFLLYLIQESMIPGKKLLDAVKVVEKLQENYKKLRKKLIGRDVAIKEVGQTGNQP